MFFILIFLILYVCLFLHFYVFDFYFCIYILIFFCLFYFLFYFFLAVLWSLSLRSRHEVSIKVDSCYERSVKGSKVKSVNKWTFIDARKIIW